MVLGLLCVMAHREVIYLVSKNYVVVPESYDVLLRRNEKTSRSFDSARPWTTQDQCFETLGLCFKSKYKTKEGIVFGVATCEVCSLALA